MQQQCYQNIIWKARAAWKSSHVVTDSAEHVTIMRESWVLEEISSRSRKEEFVLELECVRQARLKTGKIRERPREVIFRPVKAGFERSFPIFIQLELVTRCFVDGGCRFLNANFQAAVLHATHDEVYLPFAGVVEVISFHKVFPVVELEPEMQPSLSFHSESVGARLEANLSVAPRLCPTSKIVMTDESGLVFFEMRSDHSIFDALPLVCILAFERRIVPVTVSIRP